MRYAERFAVVRYLRSSTCPTWEHVAVGVSYDSALRFIERQLGNGPSPYAWRIVDERGELVPGLDFEPREVAWRTVGDSTWHRRIVRTRAAFMRLVAKLDEAGADVKWRDAEEGE